MTEPIPFIQEPKFEKRGLHNWRNLFKKPDLKDWTILIMLILVFGMAFAYKEDTIQCRNLLETLPTIACAYCHQVLSGNSTDIRYTEQLNITNFTFKESYNIEDS